MSATLLSLLAICVGSWAWAAPEITEGRIFSTEEGASEPLYYLETISTRESPELKISRTRYLDLARNPLVTEDTHYVNGTLRLYTYHQLQTDEKGSIEIKDGKIHYTYTSGGETETEVDEIEEQMFVPDMIGGILARNWEKIMKGESVYGRFLLLERLETIGFKFFKDEERLFNGIPAVNIIMKPSSFIIAALAPSIRLTVEKNPPHRLLEVLGRLQIRRAVKVPPKLRRDWKAIDGRVTLTYRSGPTDSLPAESPRPQAPPESPPKAPEKVRAPRMLPAPRAPLLPHR